MSSGRCVGPEEAEELKSLGEGYERFIGGDTGSGEGEAAETGAGIVSLVLPIKRWYFIIQEYTTLNAK